MPEPAADVLALPLISADPSAISGDVVLGVAGAGVDVLAPVVSNFSPPNGTVIERADPIFFDVTDNTGLFRRVIILVQQAARWEAAFDGDVFLAPYLSSARINIAGGFRFTLRRDEEWTGPVTVQVHAIDRSGNEA